MSDHKPAEPLAEIEAEVEALGDGIAELRADVKQGRLLAKDHGLRIRELEHDLAALADLLGAQMGEPFRSQANEIVSKHQITSEEA